MIEMSEEKKTGMEMTENRKDALLTNTVTKATSFITKTVK